MGPQMKKSEGAQSGDLGVGARELSEVILTNAPNLAMRKFIVRVRTWMFQCSVLLEEEIPGISSQLRKQPQLKLIQLNCTHHSPLAEEKWLACETAQ